MHRATTLEIHRRYKDFVAAVLTPYVPAAALVELGAGYGSIVIDLARRPVFHDMLVLAGELTTSGTRLIAMLADAEGVSIHAGHCDLMSVPVTTLAIPPKALIYTSYAAQYIPLLSQSFVESLIALDPATVVHIEPCYEHCEGKTLLGLMRRRYIQVNDYNTNLVTVLREQSDRGAIEIVDERPAVFGSNPLLAASVIVWRPLRHR
jgi:hypothetical protein